MFRTCTNWGRVGLHHLNITGKQKFIFKKLGLGLKCTKIISKKLFSKIYFQKFIFKNLYFQNCKKKVGLGWGHSKNFLKTHSHYSALKVTGNRKWRHRNRKWRHKPEVVTDQTRCSLLKYLKLNSIVF